MNKKVLVLLLSFVLLSFLFFIFPVLFLSFIFFFLSSLFSFVAEAQKYNDANRKENRPFFRASVILAIPNITMQPALDEVQQAINKAVHLIVGVSKHVALWSKQRQRTEKSKEESMNDCRDRRGSLLSNTASESSRSDLVTRSSRSRIEFEGSTNFSSVHHLSKSYYKFVSENKEISKLVSVLSTAINSTKKVSFTILYNFPDH